jgi:hypothetical protein
MQNVFMFGISLFTEFVECQMTILSLQTGQFQKNSGILNINTSNEYNLR